MGLLFDYRLQKIKSIFWNRSFWFFFIFQFETFSFFVSCLVETTSGNLSNRIIEKLERVSFLKKDTSHHNDNKKMEQKVFLSQKTSIICNKINVIVKAVLFHWMSGVGINCSKFDCSTINWLTLLAGNQLLDTKFINCSNPVNPGSTGQFFTYRNG